MPDRVHGGTPGWRDDPAVRLRWAVVRAFEKVPVANRPWNERVADALLDDDRLLADLRAALAASSGPGVDVPAPPQEGGGGLAAPRNWSHSLNDGAMVVDPLPPAGVQVDREAAGRIRQVLASMPAWAASTTDGGFAGALTDVYGFDAHAVIDGTGAATRIARFTADVAAALAPLLGTPGETP